MPRAPWRDLASVSLGLLIGLMSAPIGSSVAQSASLSDRLRQIVSTTSVALPDIEPSSRVASPIAASASCQASQATPDFLVMGGGGAPSYNEIALEKNVLYFQRTLEAMGLPPSASIFFANGNDGQATVRYLDSQQQEQFQVPSIPNLQGAATLNHLQQWFQQRQRSADRRPIFFYFTGHGFHNLANDNNNAMIFWNETLLSVRQFTRLLDTLPPEIPVVTMMSQCYAGAFANLIYEGGEPSRPIALQTRCGFFATVKSRPSVGCTPEVNEADYQDYSSSFFAGLSGQSRTGEPVPSADYNHDGRVSYAEAHAFAKVDEQTTDLPVSTVEVWLQEQSSRDQQNRILSQPIAELLAIAPIERQYVVRALVARFQLKTNQSFDQNIKTLKPQPVLAPEIEEAYLIRLGMELVNIAMEHQLRTRATPETVAILDRLIQCEAGSW